MCIAHISPYRHYSVLFQGGVLFNIENPKFWPILSILSQIYALFGVPLEWKNGQIWGMWMWSWVQGGEEHWNSGHLAASHHFAPYTSLIISWLIWRCITDLKIDICPQRKISFTFFSTHFPYFPLQCLIHPLEYSHTQRSCLFLIQIQVNKQGACDDHQDN